MRKKLSLLLFGLLISAQLIFAQTTSGKWTDKSPHREAFAQAGGIKLHYLDWGGKGESMLFLAGLGNTAHIFDNIAPGFTNSFRVLALTRRGYGQSDRPATGYDMDALAEDVLHFIDAMKIRRVILAGHSMGGYELTRFASKFPDRVSKLVYLDAAYDFAGKAELMAQLDAVTPSPSAKDRASFSTLLKWFQTNRPGWNDACETDFRLTRQTTSNGYSPRASIPDSIEEALYKAAMESSPDYKKIRVPALAFFADHQFDRFLANADEATRKKEQEIANAGKSWQREQIERFKTDIRTNRVVELTDTDHFCFIQRQDAVVRQMQSFLKL